MDSIKFSCSFAEESIAYQGILPAIRMYFSTLNIKEAGLLQVAIAEALTNAIHASKGKMVFLSMQFNPTQNLKVRIRDCGNGFDVEKELNRLAMWSLEDSEEIYSVESGRGLWIIQQVFDNIKFNSKGNEIVMVKEI